MIFQATSNQGNLSLGSDYNRARFKDFLKKNDGIRLKIEPQLPESKHQQGFYHGGVLALWAYLNGMDWRDSEVLDWLHHHAKQEFNGEAVVLDGKATRMGKSTKGKLNEFVNTVIDYLEEQYGIDRFKVLDPKDFKYYRDKIRDQVNAPETYIDYLLFTKKL